MLLKNRVRMLCILATVVCATLGAVALAAGNSFIVGDLRVDLPDVYNAKDYRVHLLAGDKPSTGDIRDFSTAWLGIFLGQYDGSPGSGQFSQVGLRATRDGIQWFVYAEPGVYCYRGSNPDPSHCYGDYSDIVTIGGWHQVRLYKGASEGYWYARVYDEYGNYSTVARINSQSNRIYLARSDTEEGYYESSDPFITLQFYHWHPQFMKGGNWADWPESDSIGKSEIWTSPSTICPDHYGATPNLLGNDRYWYAGTGGPTCEYVLFPSERIYLPIVQYK
ncbi:MAG: hypothetical protein U9R58_09310 [Chloroflexota bacterium]|nr:hypothetical protein [Chloroflexota bacterium]